MIRASAETCYECLRGENKQKLEVLSFEMAWDEIERDRFTIGNFRNGTNVEKFISRHILVA